MNELMGFKREYDRASNSGPPVRGKPNPTSKQPNKSLGPGANACKAFQLSTFPDLEIARKPCQEKGENLASGKFHPPTFQDDQLKL